MRGVPPGNEWVPNSVLRGTGGAYVYKELPPWCLAGNHWVEPARDLRSMRRRRPVTRRRPSLAPGPVPAPGPAPFSFFISFLCAFRPRPCTIGECVGAGYSIFRIFSFRLWGRTVHQAFFSSGAGESPRPCATLFKIHLRLWFSGPGHVATYPPSGIIESSRPVARSRVFRGVGREGAALGLLSLLYNY